MSAQPCGCDPEARHVCMWHSTSAEAPKQELDRPTNPQTTLHTGCYVPMNVMWNIGDAVRLIRDIQPEFHKFGFHVCLAGGVLNKGYSDKDLDLVFVPLTNETRPDPKPLYKWFLDSWGEPQDNVTDPKPCVSLRYQASYLIPVNEIRSTPGMNYREIVNRRIDVFVV